MTVYQLSKKLWFPDPRNAEPEGLLAFGGDLSPRRVLLAYQMGIFPWYSSGQPILWWSPNPRLVLFPNEMHISKSLKRVIKSKKFTITFDTRFTDVISYCADVPRKDENGTWITDDMIEAYSHLHEQGFAHSVEVFLENELVGGLYGISLGKSFFGESMFSLQNNASKVALAALTDLVKQWEFDFIDCQLPTNHLKGLGAIEIRRDRFLSLLSITKRTPTRQGKWTNEASLSLGLFN